MRLREFYRGLASLLRAGVVPSAALSSLREHGTLPDPLGHAAQRAVEDGRALSEALARFPDEVPAEDVALLEAGEATRRVVESLERLAELHDARRRSLSRLLTQAGYPLLLFHMAAFLTPIPGSMAADNGSLFGPTWRTTVLLILGPAYAVAAAVFLLSRKERGRALLRRLLDRVPVFGAAARHRRRARLATVLGAGYEAGMKLDRALELAGSAAHLPPARAAAALIARGTPLSSALATAGAVPPAMLGRIRTGEESGELSKVFDEIAREEDEAADTLYTRATGMLAKGLYVAMAIWILLYALGTLTRAYTWPI